MDNAGVDYSIVLTVMTSIQQNRKNNDFRGAKIILAHAGDQSDRKIMLETMQGVKCYYDTSFCLEEMLNDPYSLELMKQNEDYFVFGTDSPWQDQKHYVDLIKNSALFSSEQKEKIFYKNALKLITID